VTTHFAHSIYRALAFLSDVSRLDARCYYSRRRWSEQPLRERPIMLSKSRVISDSITSKWRTITLRHPWLFIPTKASRYIHLNIIIIDRAQVMSQRFASKIIFRNINNVI